MYKSIDLFAGIGGIRLGFEQAFEGEIDTVFVSEIDENAQKTYKANFSTPEKITGDITVVKEKDVPPFDFCLAGFPCLTGDTLILTKNGYKRICDIDGRDEVLSHDGLFHKVEAKMYQGEQPIYSIKTAGCININATPKHLFLARKIEKKDGVKVMGKPQWIPIEEILKDNFKLYMLASPVVKNIEVYSLTDDNSPDKAKGFPRVNTHDNDLWYLLGRYVGNGKLKTKYDKESGKVQVKGICIRCKKHETPNIIERYEGEYNFSVVFGKMADKIYFNDPDLGELAQSFGECNFNKNIPGSALNLPKCLLHSFIDGYTDSAFGFKNKKGTECRIISCNLKLLYGIAHCIEKAYEVPCFISQGKRNFYKKFDGKPLYHSESFILTFSTKYKPIADSEFIWYPITEIEEQGIEPVYDIQIEGANSFVANHTVSHNCQAFSMAGKRKGFEDDYHGVCRGTLFLDVARICEHHQPKVIFCENVKGLVSHNKGDTLKVIINTFEQIGYNVFHKVLNSKDFGVPQNRERIYIVAFRKDIDSSNFKFPEPTDTSKTIRDIMEENPVSVKYYLSDVYMQTLINHKKRHEAKGNGFGYEIRNLDGVAGAIVCGGMGRERNLIIDKRLTDFTPITHIKGEVNRDGIRKMTPREWARLQGFPDTYKLELADVHLYKQFGNSVTVPVIKAIAGKIKEVLN